MFRIPARTTNSAKSLFMKIHNTTSGIFLVRFSIFKLYLDFRSFFIRSFVPIFLHFIYCKTFVIHLQSWYKSSICYVVYYIF